MPRNSNFAATATAVLIAALFIGFRVFRIVHPHPFTPYDSYIFFGVGIILVILLMRTAVVAAVPGSYTFPDARPEQYPQLDRATFDRCATEIEGLGFQKVQDFSLVGQGGVSIPSFCRLYVHPREKMYAELAQIFPAGRSPLPVLCTMQTVFDNDWSLGVGNNQPQPAAVFLRNPRGVGKAMPGKSPFEVWQTHREWRQQMIQDLSIQPQDVSLEAYRAHQQIRAQQRAERVRKGSFLAKLSMYYKRKAAPVYEWKGNWPKEAEKRGFRSF
ncbi:MAG TPA: hypothetical protein VK738_12550 [Terriglobales bacterium]|jgi:hypothetical protein|nr:hypothetical protein [Terriglobales bacterium]